MPALKREGESEGRSIEVVRRGSAISGLRVPRSDHALASGRSDEVSRCMALVCSLARRHKDRRSA